MTASERIALGFSALADLLAEHPSALSEGGSSWREFFPGAAANEPWQPTWVDADMDPARLAARRRHLEWFCLERPSEALEASPVTALREALLQQLTEEGELDGPDAADLVARLRDSRLGVFEVGEVQPGVGLWVRDLLAMGEYPIAEVQASNELETGDVLAGRLYPLGDGQFSLSPAVGVFRDETVLEALKRDMERARSGRRGSLRVSQLELERIFFGASGQGAAEASAALAFLDQSGVEVAQVAAWKRELEALAGAGDRASGMRLIGEILDALAFETSVDLEGARARLHTAWDGWMSGGASVDGSGASGPAVTGDPASEAAAGESLGDASPNDVRSPGSAGPAAARDVSPPSSAPNLGEALGAWRRGASRPSADKHATPEPPSEDGPGASREDVAAALEAFDKARSEGADLEQLFTQLEQDLDCGAEAEAAEPDAETAPDFPGVLSAVVEEFLWDVTRDGEPTSVAEADRRAVWLRALAQYGAAVGLLEDLNATLLEQFAGRHALLSGRLQSADDAYDLLGHLEDFCRWLREEHQLGSEGAFEESLGALAEALPRLVNLAARRGLLAGVERAPQLQPVGRLAQDIDGRWALASDPTPLFGDWPDEWLTCLRAGDAVERSVDGVLYVLPGSVARD